MRQKSHKEHILSKEVLRLQDTIKELEDRFKETKKLVDKEVTKLERLRNEEGHIETSLANLERKRKEQEAAIKTRITELELREIECRRILNEAGEKEKKCSDILRQAEKEKSEAQDKINFVLASKRQNDETMSSIEAKMNKISKAEDELERKVLEFNNLKKKSEENAKKIEQKQKENEKNLFELAKQKNILTEQERATEAERSENKHILMAAMIMKKEAQEILRRSEEKAKADQLSVDRQWNEIEIQKKKVKVMELKVRKMLRDKGIDDDFDKLKDMPESK